MKTIRVPAEVILLVFTVAPVFAHVSGALLSGTVTDPSGAAVSRAQLAIRNVSTDIERTAVSDSIGLYSAPNLTPGVCNLTIKAPGFTTEPRQGIVLNVGATKVVDCALHVGQVTEQVLVQDVAPMLQLGTSESTAIVDSIPSENCL